MALGLTYIDYQGPGMSVCMCVYVWVCVSMCEYVSLRSILAGKENKLFPCVPGLV
jgi:hypothetical protein